MSAYEPRRNNRGNYSCPYCKHKSWKSKGAATNHIKREHDREASLAETQRKSEEAIQKANAEVWQERSRAARAEKELEELKKRKTETKRYSAVVYCPTCLSVDSVNIVRGQKVGDGGCFRCGTLGGQLVEHVNVHHGDYKVEEAYGR